MSNKAKFTNSLNAQISNANMRSSEATVRWGVHEVRFRHVQSQGAFEVLFHARFCQQRCGHIAQAAALPSEMPTIQRSSP
jgi:hypothetical protein